MRHTMREAGGRQRRWVFAFIVLLLVAFSAYHVVLFIFLPERATIVPAALPGPIIMAIVLFVGLGWLIWFITARRRDDRPDVSSRPGSSPPRP